MLLTETMSQTDMIIEILIAATIFGLYIYVVYSKTCKNKYSNPNFDITLAGITVASAAIIMAMQSSLIVSLGMVGALSIVRFRHAVRNPLDLFFAFWAVSTGIMCGVGLIFLAVTLSIILTVLLMVLSRLPNSQAPALLVLRSQDIEIEWKTVIAFIKKNARHCKECSYSISSTESEVIMELCCREPQQLVANLKEMGCLSQVYYLSHDSEYRA